MGTRYFKKGYSDNRKELLEIENWLQEWKISVEWLADKVEEIS